MTEIQLSIDRLKEKFPASIIDVRRFRGEVTVVVSKKDILQICQFLFSDPELQFQFLTDLCGCDFHPETPRFEIVYLLYSMKNNARLRLKMKVGEGESAPSVASIWKAANWLKGSL